jgi:hypothetical protein
VPAAPRWLWPQLGWAAAASAASCGPAALGSRLRLWSRGGALWQRLLGTVARGPEPVECDRLAALELDAVGHPDHLPTGPFNLRDFEDADPLAPVNDDRDLVNGTDDALGDSLPSATAAPVIPAPPSLLSTPSTSRTRGPLATAAASQGVALLCPPG